MNHSLKYLTGLILCYSTVYGNVADLMSIQLGTSRLSTLLGSPKDPSKAPLIQRNNTQKGTTSNIAYSRQSLTGGVSFNFGPNFRIVAEAYIPSNEEVVVYDGIPDPSSAKIQIHHDRLTSLSALDFVPADKLEGTTTTTIPANVLITPRANLRGISRLNEHTLELRANQNTILDDKQSSSPLLAVDADFMIKPTAGESKVTVKPNMVVAMRGEFVIGENNQRNAAIGFSILNTADEIRYTNENNATSSAESEGFGKVENPGVGEKIYVLESNSRIEHNERNPESETTEDQSIWWYGVTATTTTPISDFLVANCHLGYYITEFEKKGRVTSIASAPIRNLFNETTPAECFIGSLTLTYRFID